MGAIIAVSSVALALVVVAVVRHRRARKTIRPPSEKLEWTPHDCGDPDALD